MFHDMEKYLVPFKRKNLSHKEEVEFFQKLEELEKDLYLHALSYAPLRRKVVAVLKNLFENESECKLSFDKPIRSLLKGSNMEKIVSNFRLLISPRTWIFNIIDLFSEENIEDDLGADPEFIKWYDTLKTKHKLVCKEKNDFIEANLGLVGAPANRIKVKTLSRADLNQEACFGLMRAVDKFDYKTGNKFSTYSVYWIRAYLTRAYRNNNELIRVPVHIYDINAKINKFTKTFEKTNGVAPTTKQISEGIGESELLVLSAMEKKTVVSLDRKLSPDDSENNYDFYDVQIIKDELDQFDCASFNDLKNKLVEVIEALPPREQAIIKHRFGLGNLEEHIYEDIGKKLGISRERTRQLEGEALLKMRGQFNGNNYSE